MRRTLLLTVCLIFILPACGYRFSGGGSLPGGVETLSVLMLENRTTEIGIQSRISSAVTSEVIRRDRSRIARPEDAQALLSGVVKTIQDTDIAHTGTSTASQRRVTLTVDMQLKRRDGTVIWHRHSLSDYEAYDVDTDRSRTELNRRAAIDKLSRRLAEVVYRSITDDF